MPHALVTPIGVARTNACRDDRSHVLRHRDGEVHAFAWAHATSRSLLDASRGGGGIEAPHGFHRSTRGDHARPRPHRADHSRHGEPVRGRRRTLGADLNPPAPFWWERGGQRWVRTRLPGLPSGPSLVVLHSRFSSGAIARRGPLRSQAGFPDWPHDWAGSNSYDWRANRAWWAGSRGPSSFLTVSVPSAADPRGLPLRRNGKSRRQGSGSPDAANVGTMIAHQTAAARHPNGSSPAIQRFVR